MSESPMLGELDKGTTSRMPHWLGWQALRQITEVIDEVKENSAYNTNISLQYLLSLRVVEFILNEALFVTGVTATRDSSLAQQWVESHLVWKDPLTAEYFSVVGDDYKTMERTTNRAIELAELLYNLQMVPGIYQIYRRLIMDPEHLASTMLELKGLRLLWFTGYSFRLRSGQELGENTFDCEILMPEGLLVPCEMKCKLHVDSSVYDGIIHTLRKARKQLPKYSCGIVILQIPEEWSSDPILRADLVAGINESFRNTTRIAEVLAYVESSRWDPERTWHIVSKLEFLNPRSTYRQRLGAGLFSQLTAQQVSNWLPFWILDRDTALELLVERNFT